MQLPSDLWLDRDDAHDSIDRRVDAKRLAKVDGELLHGFVDVGYLKLSLDLDDRFFREFDADVERIWKKRPANLAISPAGPESPLSFRDFDGAYRESGYRIPDLHGHSPRALDLYLNHQIFRIVELIFDEPAIAFQSLYFEFGSAQQLHRDPMFVGTEPASHLLASWTSLEDITEDSGPLAYVPGSHRLPYFEFNPGSVDRPKEITAECQAEWVEWLRQTRAKMPVSTLTCKRGETFIWHGSLLHGGMPIRNAAATRKSYVVHYSTASTYQSRTARTRVRVRGGWRREARTTDKVITRDGARGLESPRSLL